MLVHIMAAINSCTCRWHVAQLSVQEKIEGDKRNLKTPRLEDLSGTVQYRKWNGIWNEYRMTILRSWMSGPVCA